VDQFLARVPSGIKLIPSDLKKIKTTECWCNKWELPVFKCILHKWKEKAQAVQVFVCSSKSTLTWTSHPSWNVDPFLAWVQTIFMEAWDFGSHLAGDE
jgi:hypothetical protein